MLLQSAARALQSTAAWEVYYKVRQVYYRVRQLLQSAAEIITK